jgi:hypothetical protein
LGFALWVGVTEMLGYASMVSEGVGVGELSWSQAGAEASDAAGDTCPPHPADSRISAEQVAARSEKRGVMPHTVGAWGVGVR